MTRAIRIVVTLLVTGLCLAYLVWKIDISKTAAILVDADLGYFVLAVAIMAVTVWPMTWRWQQLLAAKGMHDPLSWLVRAYFVSYTASAVLPSSIGGDAMRMYETARRHPGRGGPVAASVVLERALGGVATLILAAVGFVLAIGRYPVGPYLWVEAVFVVGTIVLAGLFFSRRARGPLSRLAPLLRRVWLEKPLRAVYEGIHAYREHVRLLVGLLAFTVVVQAVRILPVWCCAKAVGIDVSVRVFYVMGPLLFLVLLFPFTLNGIAVREAFFVSFLGRLDVPPDAAFSAGFLFLFVTLTLAVPGVFILGWEALRGSARPSFPRARP